MPDGLENLAQAFGVKTPAKSSSLGDASVASVVDDELQKLGYPSAARLSFLGDTGRENSWNRETIFQGHKDPKNGAYNRGIISWQGDRQSALNDFLNQQGVLGRHDDDELRGMVRFADHELQSKYPDVYQTLRNAQSTYDASEALRRYINYVPDAPFNTYDPEFRVANNRKYAEEARRLGLGVDHQPLEDLAAQFGVGASQPEQPQMLSGLENAFATRAGQATTTTTPQQPAQPGHMPSALTPPAAPAIDGQRPLLDPAAVQTPEEQKQNLLAARKALSDQLQTAKTPARRNILITRIKQVDDQLLTVAQQARAIEAAPQTEQAPATAEEPMTVSAQTPAVAHPANNSFGHPSRKKHYTTSSGRILDDEPAQQSQQGEQPTPSVEAITHYTDPELRRQAADSFGGKGTDEQVETQFQNLKRQQQAKYDAMVSDIITPPKGLDAPRAAEYVKSQISAKYGIDRSKMAGWQFLGGRTPGKPVEVTYADLKNAGVDTDSLINDARARQRVEEPTPDTGLRTPIYDQAAENVFRDPFGGGTNADVDAERARLTRTELTDDETRNAQSIGDFISGFAHSGRPGSELAGGTTAGLIESTGRGAELISGLYKYTLPGLIDRLRGRTELPDAVSHFANEAKVVGMSAKGDGIVFDVGRVGGNLAGDAPRLIGLTALTGGNPVLAFGLDEFARSSGRNEPIATQAAHGVKGLALGALFHGASRLGNIVEEGVLDTALTKTPLGETTEQATASESFVSKLQKMLEHERSARDIGSTAEADAFAGKIKQLLDKHGLSMKDLEGAGPDLDRKVAAILAAKLAGEATRVGTIGAGGFLLSKAEGQSNKDAFYNTALLLLTDLGFNHTKYGEVADLSGKVIRVWKNGGFKDLLVWAKDAAKNGRGTKADIYDVTGKVDDSQVQSVVSDDDLARSRTPLMLEGEVEPPSDTKPIPKPSEPLPPNAPVEPGQRVTIEGRGEGVVVEDKGKTAVVDHNPKPGKDGDIKYQSRSIVRKDQLTPFSDEVPSAPMGNSEFSQQLAEWREAARKEGDLAEDDDFDAYTDVWHDSTGKAHPIVNTGDVVKHNGREIEVTAGNNPYQFPSEEAAEAGVKTFEGKEPGSDKVETLDAAKIETDKTGKPNVVRTVESEKPNYVEPSPAPPKEQASQPVAKPARPPRVQGIELKPKAAKPAETKPVAEDLSSSEDAADWHPVSDKTERIAAFKPGEYFGWPDSGRVYKVLTEEDRSGLIKAQNVVSGSVEPYNAQNNSAYRLEKRPSSETQTSDIGTKTPPTDAQASPEPVSAPDGYVDGRPVSIVGESPGKYKVQFLDGKKETPIVRRAEFTPANKAAAPKSVEEVPLGSEYEDVRDGDVWTAKEYKTYKRPNGESYQAIQFEQTNKKGETYVRWVEPKNLPDVLRPVAQGSLLKDAATPAKSLTLSDSKGGEPLASIDLLTGEGGGSDKFMVKRQARAGSVGHKYVDATVYNSREEAIKAAAAGIIEWAQKYDPADLPRADQKKLPNIIKWARQQWLDAGGKATAIPGADGGKDALREFQADDKAFDLIKKIRNGEAGNSTEKDLRSLADEYGVSDADFQEVLNRANKERARREREKRTNDVVREAREPETEPARGSETTIEIPDSDKTYKARYVIRDIADVYPSHNAQTFQPNPDYYFVNDRHYDKEEQYQLQVIDRSRPENFKPNLLINDSPTVEIGPPVIDAEGNVLGGNSRAMIISRIYQLANDTAASEIAYKDALKAKASQFGIDPSMLRLFEDPILVREILDTDLDEQSAITDLNKTSTTDLTSQEKSVAEATKLSDDAVEYITNKIESTGDEATLPETLKDHGVAIVNHLIEDGVFGAGERNVLIDDGKITEDGKRRIERLLLGKVFADLDQLELVPASIRNVLTRVISPLMKVNRDPEWNILEPVREAIDLVNEAKAVGMGKHLDNFADQVSFVRPQGWTPQALGIAKVLSSGLKSATADFKQYAEDMRLARYNEGAMFDLGAKTQADAFKDAFGVMPAEKADDVTVPRITDQEQTTGKPEKSASPNATAAKAPKEGIAPETPRESAVQNNAVAPDTSAAFDQAFDDLFAKPEPAKDDLASAADDIASIMGFERPEDEPPTLKSILGDGEPAIDETKYTKLAVVFNAALEKFEGEDPVAKMKELLGYLNTKARFTPEQIAQLKPYVVRFFNDKNALQTGAKGSIEKADERADTANSGGDREPRQPEQRDAGAERDGKALGGGRSQRAETARDERPADAAPDKPSASTRGSSKSQSEPNESLGQRGFDFGGDTYTAPADNFVITNELDFERFSPKQRLKGNLEALKLLKEIEAEHRSATPDEQKVLARYVGWGGLKNVFKEDGKDFAAEREELKQLVTPEEYDRARRSVLDSHYTSKPIVESIWRAVRQFGFERGSVLEPAMGVGNFLGLMPKDAATSIVGVEYDPLTSAIAKQLYPNAQIHNKGFQDVYIAPGSVDLVVGNPPFGAQSLYDKESPERSKFRIHAYFFAKAADVVRPGGLISMVVSKGLLDSKAPEAITAREYIAKRARLLGAVRLPNNAFGENANTDVTTDIVFLQKLDGMDVKSNADEWVPVEKYVNDAGEEMLINKYFVDDPSMMLGRMTLAGSMYRDNEPTLEPHPDQEDLEADIADAISSMPEKVYSSDTKAITERLQAAAGRDLSEYDQIRPYNYGINSAGELFQLRVDLNEKAYEIPVAAKGKELERIKGMIEIRKTVRALLAQEADPGVADFQLVPLRERLNREYDRFVKANGYLSADANARAFREDADYPLLMALERDYDRGISRDVAKKEGVDPRPPSARKADIFTKRTTVPVKTVTNVDNAQDAMLASMNERGRVDLGYMSDLYGKDEAEILRELGDLVYQEPPAADGRVGQWQIRDEYLSGDVKTKLAEAIAAAAERPEFARNVRALEAVQPADIPPTEIFVKLGSSWVPPEDYEAFIKDLIDGSLRATYNQQLGRYLELKVSSTNDTLNLNKWGTQRMPASKIIEALMTNKQPKVQDPYEDVDGKTKYRVNEPETAAALGKADEITEAFIDWMWKEPERRQRLAALYNEKMNRRVNRKHDGSYLTLPGKNPNIIMRKHQTDFVARGIQHGVVLGDHVVGAGKTFASISLAMELRRLGLAKKPMIPVPNHLVDQWARDFKLLYPGSNVLAATKRDFEKPRRRELFAKIATGDWDAVIVAHSSFGFIPVPAEVEKKFLEDQVWDLTFAIEQMRKLQGKKDLSVRQFEEMKERLEQKIKQLADRKRDDGLDFAEMGIDALLVDEAHKFKNLFFTTQKQGVGSLGDPAGSQRAFDMWMKVQMVLERNNGRNVFFLTGTPVSNSLAEIFHMQRFLQLKTLKAMGIHTFDAWANTFGQDTMDWELDASGKFRQKLRFVKFANLPELRQLWREVADTVTNDMIMKAAEEEGRPFALPKILRKKVIVPRSEDQAEFIGVPQPRLDADGNQMFDEETGEPLADYPRDSIVYRLDNWKQIQKDEDPKENPLRITGDARKAGLDMRCIADHYPEYPEGKVGRLADEIYRIWKENDHRKGTQLVFLDLSVPKKARRSTAHLAEDPEKMFLRREQDGRLHLVSGHKFQLPELPDAKLYSYWDNGRYMIADDSSGGLIVEGRDSKDAVNRLTISLHKYGTKMIERQIADNKVEPERRQALVDEYRRFQSNLDAVPEDLPDEINSTGVVESRGQFSAYQAIRDLLIEKGVPKEQIAFIHDYNTDLQKAKLFAQANRGDVRVLLGSTEKMGAGTNVQKKLVALHHGDVPWKPSDLEQRNGRGIRQGNEFADPSLGSPHYDPEFTLEILDYATEKTYDARMWEIIEQKGTAIDRFRLSDDVREVEDVSPESANAAEMKASATGDPRILESIQLKSEIKKLDAQKKVFDRSKFDVQDKIRAFEAKDTKAHIMLEKANQALAIAAANPKNDDTTISFGEHTFVAKDINEEPNRETASRAIVAKFQRLQKLDQDQVLGRYRGFDLTLRIVPFYRQVQLLLQKDGRVYNDSVFDEDTAKNPSLRGVMVRVENMVDKLVGLKATAEVQLARLKTEYEAAKNEKEAEFPKAAELAAMKQRHAEILEQLRAKRAPKKQQEATSEEPDTLKSAIEQNPEILAPIFYSQLERTIEQRMPAKAGAAQIRGILKDTKQEERDWLGIDQWLDENPNPTKDEVLSFVRENNAKLREVVHGDASEIFDRAEAVRRLDAGEEVLAIDDEGHEFRVEDEDDLSRARRFTTEDALEDAGESPTKYSQYTLPGGENYRELLLTLPAKDLTLTINEKWKEFERTGAYPVKAEYYSPHFEEPNILVHIRFDERDGGRTLHIAEVQSDWHQHGRDRGYSARPGELADAERVDNELKARAESLSTQMKAIQTEMENAESISDSVKRQWDKLRRQRDEINKQREETYGRLFDLRQLQQKGVPDAPFKKTWHELAMKRMIRYAAEHGYDRLTWDTGETTAERFNLSKTVESIAWKTERGGKTVALKTHAGSFTSFVIDDQGIVSQDPSGPNLPKEMKGKPLADVVGKAVAEKIMEQPDGELKGDGLAIGGVGLKGFYDKILPAFVNKYVKKWGGKVEQRDLEVPQDGQPFAVMTEDDELVFAFSTKKEAEEYLELNDPDGKEGFYVDDFSSSVKDLVPAHSLDITRQMRDSVLREGQRLYKLATDELEGEDRLTYEQMQQLPYAPFDELLERAEAHRFGSEIKANAQSHEIFRRTFEEANIRVGKRKRGSTKVEDLFAGVFLKPETVETTVDILREKATEAKDLGYSPEEVAVFESHAQMLEEAAKEGDGTAIVYVFDNALPEEFFHQADYLGAAEKTLLNRHTEQAKKLLDAHPVATKLWRQHFSKFTEYTAIKSKSTLAAVLRAEIPPYLLDLSDKDLAELGITPDERDDYLLKWFEGYAAKNGIESLDHFDRDEIDVQSFINQVKAAVGTSDKNGQARKEDEAHPQGTEPDGTGETRAGPRGRKSSKGKDKVDPAAFDEDARDFFELGPNEKFASLPGTLRRAALDADDIVYQVFGDRAAIAQAERLLDENGIPGSIKLIRDVRAKDLDVHHAVLSFMLQRVLLDHAQSISRRDPEAAQEARVLARKLAREHSLRAIGAGRFTRGASIVSHSVENLIYSVQGMVTDKYGEDKTLSPEEWDRIESKGREAEEAIARVAEVEKEKRWLQQKIKRMEAERDGRRKRSKTPRSLKKFRQLADLVLKDTDNAKEIAQAKADLLKQFEAPATLKAVLVGDYPVDAIKPVYNDKGQLLAPNGKPSNLPNLHTWKMVRTPEFKRWFGDWEDKRFDASKLVDENGEPRIMSHGTKAIHDFKAFRPSHADIGVHFGTVGQANDRLDFTRPKAGLDAPERILPAFLNIRNPLRVIDAGSWSFRSLEHILQGKVDAQTIRMIRNFSDASGDLEYEYMEGLGLEPGDEVPEGTPYFDETDEYKNLQDEFGESMREELKRQGYDGLVYKNSGETTGGYEISQRVADAYMAVEDKFGPWVGSRPDIEASPEAKAYRRLLDDAQRFRDENSEDSYITFDPQQIKSVFNRGEFDPADPDTLKSVLDAGGLDEETLDKLGIVGAELLTEGLASPDDYLPKDFYAEMVATYGDVIGPHFQDVYTRAWKKRSEWLEKARREQAKERLENTVDESGNPVYGENLEEWEVDEILGQRKEAARRRRAIESMHRMMAGDLGKRKPNLANYKRIIPEVAADEEAALAGILIAENLNPHEIYRQLAEMGVTDPREQREALRKGNEAFNKAKIELRLENDKINADIADLQKLQQDIDDARWAARRRAQETMRSIEHELRRIKDGEFWYRTGQVMDVFNVMRTLMASGDLSGALRQGGFFSIALPEHQKQAFADMLHSLTEQGYGRVIMQIERHPDFVLAQRSGVDFAMAGKREDEFGEELFRGEETLEAMSKYIPGLGKLVMEGLIKPSERTYTAVLDSQRMAMFSLFAEELKAAGLDYRRNRIEFEKLGKFISVATGRGATPRSQMGRLLLDLPFFAPRYALSRFQLLNMTLNPVAYYNLPPNVRRVVGRSAARFYSTLGIILGIGAAFGLVALDPDDSDFMKIKVGSSRIDLFAGTLQPAKMVIKLMMAAARGDRIPGEAARDSVQAVGRFVRGKLSPLWSLGSDWWFGEDYVGNEFSLVKGVGSRFVPLTIADAYDAYQVEGPAGLLTVPLTVIGLGVQTYKDRPEKPVTAAEKLAAKAIAMRMENKRSTKQEKDVREAIQQLTARSRAGEDVSQDLEALPKGMITDQQKKNILDARTKTYLEDKAEGLSLDEFEAVYSVANADERQRLKYLLDKKMKNALIQGKLTDTQRQRLEKMGGSVLGDLPMPDQVKDEFDRYRLPIPDVGETVTVKKGEGKTRLTPEQYDTHRREALREIYSRALKLVESEAYQNADPEKQKALLQKAVRKGRAVELKDTKRELRQLP